MHSVDEFHGQDMEPEAFVFFEAFRVAFERELLRQAIRRALQVYGGQRVVASMIGVGRTVLRKFLSMETTPEAANQQKMLEWLSDRPQVVPDVRAVCTAILVEDLLPEHRASARAELSTLLKRYYDDGRLPTPTWLKAELGSD